MTPPYPPAHRLDLTERLPPSEPRHEVADPYRWLEDLDSPATTAWLDAQDRLWQETRATWVGGDRWEQVFRDAAAHGAVTSPAWFGSRQVRSTWDGTSNHWVTECVEPDGTVRMLLDPNALDPSGATVVDGLSVSIEGDRFAYQLSERGEEKSLLWVKDVVTGEILDGPIDRLRLSPVAWLPGGAAFYYVRHLPAGDGVPSGKEHEHRRVYLHRVGADPDEDVEVFGAGLAPNASLSVDVDDDGEWLYVSATWGYESSDIWVADLRTSSADQPELRALQVGVAAKSSVGIAGPDKLAYIRTDRDAPRGRLCVTDADRLDYAHWRTLVAADPDAVLSSYVLLYGDELAEPTLVCLWTRHARSELTVHDLRTGRRRDGAAGVIALPGVGTVSFLTTRQHQPAEFWFCYEDVTTPVSVYRYDARTAALTVWARPPGVYAAPEVTKQELEYSSADGTSVRMLVVAPAGGDAERPRPTVMDVYGGFGLSMAPAFNSFALAWVAAGGVFAQPALRGGAEEGKAWHDAGRREHKQHTFDDVHAAAEALIREGWTTSNQLALRGGSNGGLTVGAALTQRPELYAAVVCSAPLLDMARYELFGYGTTWQEEYGTASDPEQLGWLLSYSPYHAVREGTAYPAVLLMSFNGDGLVDPLHARKMCAALQHATGGAQPVLLRREADVGHGAPGFNKLLAAAVDEMLFLAAHTGLDGPDFAH